MTHGDRTDAVLAAYKTDMINQPNGGRRRFRRSKFCVGDAYLGRAVEAKGKMPICISFALPSCVLDLCPERAAIDMPDGPTGYGAYHSGDLAYAFWGKHDWAVWMDRWDHEISETMRAFGGIFRRRENPKGDGLPTWPRYEAATDPWLEFGLKFGEPRYSKKKARSF
ncbi:MAG: hypothetical protein Ct9H300mP25_17560 [Acidobacteriota bacterium]|nr:MAG: hypothetical protein Ct9H300mP25_17560 [Acidobacteriota bacterium]